MKTSIQLNGKRITPSVCSGQSNIGRAEQLSERSSRLATAGESILCLEPTDLAQGGLYHTGTRTLWVPDGVYVIDDPEGASKVDDLWKKGSLNKVELDRMILPGSKRNGVFHSKDGSARFMQSRDIPFGRAVNPHEDPAYLIALVGEDFAEKTIRVGQNYRTGLHLRGAPQKESNTVIKSLRVGSTSEIWPKKTQC